MLSKEVYEQTKDATLCWHMEHNHIPSQRRYIPFARKAIELYNQGLVDEEVIAEVDGREGKLQAENGTFLTAAQGIKNWRLESWIEKDEVE